MSHFFTIVAVPEGTEDIRAYVGTALAPYDENLDVQEYDRECYCVGRQAVNDANTQVNALRNMEDMRTFARQLGDRMGEEAADKFWQALCDWRDARVEDYTENDPRAGEPNPECEECGGTGFYKSTYNPKSKWDWWVIGGRWNGSVRNDSRDSEDGFNFGPQYRELSENLVDAHNYVLTEESRPYAFLDLNGKWWAKGKMGWFGMSSDERTGWERTVERLAAEAATQNALLVGVDLHI